MKGAFFIILATLFWALDTLIRYPLITEGMSATSIVFYEHVILCLIFTPSIYSLIKSKIWQQKNVLVSFFLIGGVGSAISTIAFTKAFYYLNPSIVIVMQKLQPMVAILLAHFFLGEKLTRPFIKWALVCLLGGLFMSWSDFYQGMVVIFQGNYWSDNGYQGLLGYAFALIAVVGWGQTTVFSKKLTNQGLSEQQIMAGRFFMGLVTIFIFMSFQQLSFTIVTDKLLKIVLMVFLSGLVAMYFYYKGLKQVSARYCALLEMFFPFFAVCINWIFLDKNLELNQLFGIIFLSLGSLMIDLKKY